MPHHSLANEEGVNKFIAVGIDFGTTYCGVSWAFSEIPNEIHEITEWPSANHQSQGETQVPSKYDIETGKWGYEITADMDPVRWFKLLLLRSEDIHQQMIRDSVHVKHARDQLSKSNPPLTAVEVIGRYLGKLWEHSYSQVQDVLDLDSFPLRVAITVPAIWPPYAHEAMKTAAALAGILNKRDIGSTTLDFVQEPEAAGLCTLFHQGKLQTVETGDSFVVCDAGGGTVDVISYQVTSVSPFCLKECVTGDGMLAGAIKVDDEFEEHLRRKTNLRLRNLDDTEYNTFFTRDWEHGVKRIFKGASSPPQFSLSPPINALKKRDKVANILSWSGKDKYIITKMELTSFFNPSLTGIRSLVGAQVRGVLEATKEEPKKILLVGGLGSSPYIHEMLKKQYPNKVLRPTHAWSAVARGAVIRLLQDRLAQTPKLNEQQRTLLVQIPEVLTRKARYSYGVISLHPIAGLSDYDSDVDDIKLDPSGRKDTLRIDWYLKKGADLSKTSPVNWTYSTLARFQAEAQCILKVICCQSDDPPIRPAPEVLDLCSISCDWGKPFEEWTPIGDPKLGWRRFDGLSVRMRYEGQLKWTVKAAAHAVEREIEADYGAERGRVIHS
ncbi:hypothetical protein B0T25DRAFT_563750 [Lasiosphaeria hispida]|uniref:Actin-like ATPase domain-containing protein n=1 Tax=Lasiosphaeria hispida TaxID=260671 RepID=A0AAJ0MH75_9PEZI|nr:hypothetical protein B0T25DRAFT_563750 [Lasiosphaeria hispida]